MRHQTRGGSPSWSGQRCSRGPSTRRRSCRRPGTAQACSPGWLLTHIDRTCLPACHPQPTRPVTGSRHDKHLLAGPPPPSEGVGSRRRQPAPPRYAESHCAGSAPTCSTCTSWSKSRRSAARYGDVYAVGTLDVPRHALSLGTFREVARPAGCPGAVSPVRRPLGTTAGGGPRARGLSPVSCGCPRFGLLAR